MVLFGYKTIDDGEQALIRNHEGSAKLVKGPARVTLWRSTVQKLTPYFAADGQYLEVNHKNGPRECVMGPAQMFLNPVEIASIIVREAVLVSANEALVVYRSNKMGQNTISSKISDDDLKGGIERTILYGPLRYIPKPGEWFHEFCWHGEDPTNKTRKLKGALKFTLLRTIADQFYYNVHEVRTKDDTMITVKLMVFFQLVDINKMLDNTHDPIGDFINACCSDTIQYCSGLTYEEFVDNTSKMNDINTFQQLTIRAELIGYKVSKVVFRGFHSSDALQSMHDKAIHERTRLRLEADTEEHRQKTLDLQLAKEEERSVRERELEKEREEHKRMMEREKHSEQLRRIAEKEDHDQRMLESKLINAAERSSKERELERLNVEHQIHLEQERGRLQLENDRLKSELAVNEKRMLIELEKDKVKIEKERLENLKTYEADITKVLVAECHVPDKTLRIENSNGQASNVHFHETNL